MICYILPTNTIESSRLTISFVFNIFTPSNWFFKRSLAEKPKLVDSYDVFHFSIVFLYPTIRMSNKQKPPSRRFLYLRASICFLKASHRLTSRAEQIFSRKLCRAFKKEMRASLYFTSIPALRAEPSTIFIAPARSFAFKSTIFRFAISST